MVSTAHIDPDTWAKVRANPWARAAAEAERGQLEQHGATYDGTRTMRWCFRAGAMGAASRWRRTVLLRGLTSDTDTWSITYAEHGRLRWRTRAVEPILDFIAGFFPLGPSFAVRFAGSPPRRYAERTEAATTATLPQKLFEVLYDGLPERQAARSEAFHAATGGHGSRNRGA